MGALVTKQDKSLILKSSSQLKQLLPLREQFDYALSLPHELLPELASIYAAINYMNHSCNRTDDPYYITPDEINSFIESDSYSSLCTELEEQEPVDTDDATLVVKVILSTMPINNNIDPQALAEVYMEIIRELEPSKLALHIARISLRNKLTFAPTPKEFRDTLNQTITSLSILRRAVAELPENAKLPREQAIDYSHYSRVRS